MKSNFSKQKKTKKKEMKMSKLAIDGGEKVFAKGVQTAPDWPPKYPETAELLKELYLHGSWSFYGQYEQEFNSKFAQYTGADD